MPFAVHIDTTVLPDRCRTDLFVEGGRFRSGPVDDATTLHSGGYAIPGLVDAHAHLPLYSPAEDTASEEDQIRASGRAHLEAGVLLVREPGSPSRASRDLDGQAGMPRLQTAGRFLAPPGGYFPGLAREVTPDQLPEAAGEELAWSGHWVKVIGDFFNAEGAVESVWPSEALREAAVRTHAGGGRITMHCMTIAAVEQALEAGFDAIEHGTAMTADLVDEMTRRQTTWIPTITIAEPIRRMLAENPQLEAAPILSALDTQAAMVRLAAERGVRVLAGTDAGMVPHGVVGTEIRLLAAAGLSLHDALAAGSWEARRYLGLPLIEDGAPADLVIYPDDPTEDLAVLDHPSLIMIGGTVVRHS